MAYVSYFILHILYTFRITFYAYIIDYTLRVTFILNITYLVECLSSCGGGTPELWEDCRGATVRKQMYEKEIKTNIRV